MKELKNYDESNNVTAIKKHAQKNNIKEERAYYAPLVQNKDDAISAKLKLLHGSFFGKPIVKYQIAGMRDVWIPYRYLIYDFHVERSVAFKKNGMNKDGQVALVFDLNEVHPFQYDIYESGELQLNRMPTGGLEGALLKPSASANEIEKKAEDFIQYNVMKRFYGREGKLRLKEEKMFYRPAVELEVIYKNKNKNLRYAYLDEFGIESEHILGLKYRVDNNF